MKRMICAILVVVISVLCGCVATPEPTQSSQPEESQLSGWVENNTASVVDLITKQVDIHDFSQASFSPSFYGFSFKEMNRRYGVECLRSMSESSYSVHKVKQGGYLYQFYDVVDSAYNGIGWFYVTKQLSSADFLTISAGQTTIEDILTIDPSTQIYINIFEADINRFVVSDDVAVYSTSHYLTDGIYEILYKYVDEKLVVDSTSYSPDFRLHIHTANTTVSAKLYDQDFLYDNPLNGELIMAYDLPSNYMTRIFCMTIP